MKKAALARGISKMIVIDGERLCTACTTHRCVCPQSNRSFKEPTPIMKNRAQRRNKKNEAMVQRKNGFR